ncbi:MAG: glucose 1-dehydrogenase [Clostridia bacterium]|nr:glucose 1-dehydrogenase [Clostridia bacterium]
MSSTVLITGGSRGIGAQTVRRFSAEGHNVAFTYLNSVQEAEKLSAETGALAIRADSRKTSDLTDAADRAEETFGAVDILVNNAGISVCGLVTDLTDREMEDIFQVNTIGAFRAVRAILPSMIRRKSGVIINVSSVWGIRGASCEVAYSASKAALIGMTRALAKEVGPSGIRVNCVAPGVIDTDMNASYSAEEMDELRYRTPLDRIGATSDVAGLIYFLSSEDASFITGQTVCCDGGFAV